MRILRVISSVRAEAGGPVEGIRQTATVLAELGCQVEIVSLDGPGTDSGSRFTCPVHFLGPGVSPYCYAPGYAPWLRRNAGRFDAVVVSGLWQYHGFCTRRVLRRGGPPYFVFPHGMLDPWFKRTYPLKHLKKWLYWPWAEYRVLRDARAVLFTCEEERRLARQSFSLYRCNERVVNYGTAAPTGDPEAQKALFLERFPGLHDKRLLLFLSRIHPKKGCDLLIKAFARVSKAECGAGHSSLVTRHSPLGPLHLVMAGPDQVGWVAELKTLAAQLGITDRIAWPGMLTGDTKWGAIRCADAFVLPSHQENFGIAVVEAMACGVPVLISNQVNIWREVERDGAGVVAPDTLAGTERLLERWLGLVESERRAMRGAARQSFEARFEAAAAATSLLDTIKGTPPGRQGGCESAAHFARGV
jgi:glycosyltransferase involved in cell wall biosynthesis